MSYLIDYSRYKRNFFFFASSARLSNNATIVGSKERRQIDELADCVVAQALNTLSDETYAPEQDDF